MRMWPLLYVLPALFFGFLLGLLSQPDGSFIELVKEYQTLIVGSVATVVGIATVLCLNKQIWIQIDKVADENLANSKASKATLPISLDALNEYAEQCLEQTKNACLGLNFKPVLPNVDQEAINDIRKCILFADAQTQDRLVELLHAFQVQRARFSEFIKLNSSYEKPETQTPFEEADQKSVNYPFAMETNITLILCIQELRAFATNGKQAVCEPRSRLARERSLMERRQTLDSNVIWTFNWPIFFENFEAKLKQENDQFTP